MKDTDKVLVLTLLAFVVGILVGFYLSFTNSRDVKLMEVNYCLDINDTPHICE